MKKEWKWCFTFIFFVSNYNILLQIREVLSNGPIVLIPTHRSYVDFLIVSYVFFEFDLPLPRIAAGEDFLGILFVNWIFRRSGAFFLRRSFKEDALYIALFTEYVQRLICDWSPIEFFIEGRRSRTGKSLNPKRGLLSICIEPFFEKKIPDLIMVPISISYEKVIEAELYSNELLGEQKTKESFSALIKASKILQMNFGRINVIFNQPISLKTYTEIFIKEINSSLEKNFNPFLNELDKKCLIQSLSYEIIQELNQGIVITTTSLVATVILAVRKGITHEDLITKVDWLREYISILGGMIAFDGTTGDLVDQALKLLNNLVIKIRNTYVPSSSVENGKQNKSILVLDYYRNQLVHLFINEGLIACVLFSYQKVKKDTLIDDVLFLRKLFAIEFPEKSYPTKEVYSSIIDSMTERSILLNNEDIISISENAHGHITFLCYMFWPLIDTYWLSSLSLFSLYPSHIIKKRLLIHRIQWIAEKMHSEGNLPFYESCSLEIINNTLDLFNNWKVIEYKNEENEAILPGSKRGQSRRKERKQPTIDPTEIILSPLFQKESELQNLVQNINKFRKCSTSLLSLQQNLDPITLRRLMISEFPVLSKL
jgi:glycerol-3-phosphate O-acyltransferase